MSHRTSDNLGRLDIDLARRIDEICRRFEADWRAGQQPRVEEYFGEFTGDARAALATELEAMQSELQQAAGQTGIADAPTVAPGSLPTQPKPREASSSVHDAATLPPRGYATVDLAASTRASSEAGTPSHVRYFGDYEIIRELARGGMGVVFEARQVSLNRKVALKMILAGQLADDREVKRFYTEAEAAGNLDHPGIVPIFEVGQHEGQHYFSMGFVEGQSLSQRLAEGPLPPREAAKLMGHVCEAIEYAHQRGVIHRDLKPANILLDRACNPRVTDFGLAKQVEGDSGLTGSGQIMGTPSYMPPEQAGGNRGDVGPASDVYALGATLYALLTGRPPFQAATPMDTVIQVLSDEPVPPRRLNAAVDRDLETICLKCLAKPPKGRYVSAAALGEDLRRFLAGQPILARPVSAWEHTVKWARRRPTLAALVLVGAVAVVSIVALVVGQSYRARLEQFNARLEQSNERLADALKEAERAKRAEEDQKVQTAEALAKVENYLYFQTLASAQRELAASELSRADDLLDGRPEGLRGWEWAYLKNRAHRDRSGLETADVINAMVISPTGKYVVLGGRDGSLLLRADSIGDWQSAALKGHSGTVTALAFARDGRSFASASEDQTVKNWQVMPSEAGQKLSARVAFTGTGHTGAVLAVAFGPEHRLASAGADGTVRLWDAAGTREITTLRDHVGAVRHLVSDSDGRWLVSAGDDGTIKIRDGATGAVRSTLEGHSGAVVALSVAADGKTLAAAAPGPAGEVTIWDVEARKPRFVVRGRTGRISGVAIGPDGRTLAAAGADGAVQLWDATTGQPQLILRGSGAPASTLAFHPDGRRLMAAFGETGRAGEVLLWHLFVRSDVQVLRGHLGAATGVAFSPDSQRLASSGEDGVVRVWDVATPENELGPGGREVFALKGHAGAVTGVSFGPDIQFLASAGRDGTARIWDVATGEEVRTLRGHAGPVLAVAYSPTGDRLATAGGRPDGPGEIKFWQVADGRELLTLRGHAGPAASLAFSPDGLRLASAGSGQSVQVWDLASNRELLALKGHTVAFSPDGKFLASGGQDQTVRLWDAATGRALHLLRGDSGAIADLAFFPDASRLATVGVDGALNLWNPATGLEACTIRSDVDLAAVAASPDGKRIAAARADGGVSIWTPLGPDLGARENDPKSVDFGFVREN